MINNNVLFCQGDVSDVHREQILKECSYIAMDTETTGLNAENDSLSIIQIYDGTNFYIVKFDASIKPKNINLLLADKKLTKVFHHAPFDLSFLVHHLVTSKVNNVVCTKIAYKLLHGTTNKSSLRDLTKKYLNVNLDKTQQLSNWSQSELTNEQIAYAINDVRYLMLLWGKLEENLKKEDLFIVARNCFEFLPTQALLSNKGIENIFSY